MTVDHVEVDGGDNVEMLTLEQPPLAVLRIQLCVSKFRGHSSDSHGGRTVTEENAIARQLMEAMGSCFSWSILQRS